jgi:hypothetical protein
VVVLVDVGVPPPAELAICGATGEPTGADVVIPEVGMASFGYAVHVCVTGPAGLSSVREAVGSTKSVTLLGGGDAPGGIVSGVEKNPPTSVGEEGMSSSSPDEGADPGIGTSNAKGPTITGSGCTFPVRFTCPVKDPAMAVSPEACRAETRDAGSGIWTW